MKETKVINTVNEYKQRIGSPTTASYLKTYSWWTALNQAVSRPMFFPDGQADTTIIACRDISSNSSLLGLLTNERSSVDGCVS